MVAGQSRKAPCHHQDDNGGQRENEGNHAADMLGRLLRVQIHGHGRGHPGDGNGDGIPGADALEQDDGRIDRGAILHLMKLARPRSEIEGLRLFQQLFGVHFDTKKMKKPITWSVGGSPHQVAHGAGGLVDGEVRIGVATGIGVGDGDTADRLAGPLEHRLIVVAIEQGAGDIAVAMGPAIDRDGRDVAVAGEAAGAEHAVELVADDLLEIGELHCVQLRASELELRARIVAGLDRDIAHMDQHRRGRVRRMAVAAEVDRIVELDARMDRHRRRDLVHAELHPGLPVAHQHVVVDERRLDVLRQCFALCV